MRTERTFWTQSLGEHFIVTEYTSPPVKDQTHSNQNDFTFRSSKLVKRMTEYFFLFETCFRMWMSEFKYFSGFLWSNKSTLGSCTQMSLVQEVKYKLSYKYKYKYILPHAGWGHQALEPNPDWLTVNLQGEEQALKFRLDDIVCQLFKLSLNMADIYYKKSDQHRPLVPSVLFAPEVRKITSGQFTTNFHAVNMKTIFCNPF